MDGQVVGLVGTEGQGGEKYMLSIEKEIQYPCIRKRIVLKTRLMQH